MSISECAQALLVVYSEPGPETPPETFNAWFTQDQLAAESTGPATRYNAIDGEHPQWLALYEAESPENLVGAALPKAAPELRNFSRSAYTLLSCRTLPTTTPADLPAEFLYATSITVLPEAEDAFNAWYEGAHTDMFARVPGWRRVRRYKLHAHEELGTKRSGQAPCTYLALHEWTHAEFADMPEYAAILATEQAAEMKKALLGVELRVFELCRPG